MKLLKVEPRRLHNDRLPNLKAAWRPYLIFLRCLGIVNCRSDFSNPWSDPWTLVCLICLLNTWTMLLIRWEVFKNIEFSTKKQLAANLIGMIAVCTEAASMTTLFVSTVCGKSFQNIFSLWNKLQLKPKSFKRLESRVKMASWCIFGIFLILSVTQIAAYGSFIYLLWWHSSWTTFWRFSLIFRILSLFTSVHIVGFIVLICSTLWLLFVEVNSIIEDDEPGDCVANVKAFSTLFRQAATIISAFDSLLAFVIGPYLLSYVSQVVFNTYLVFKDEMSSESNYWMGESVIMLLFVTLLPALVNIQAHRSYQLLCRVAMEDMHVPLMLLVNGLQNRLSSSPIGLSAFHMRVITIKMIPSMISIYFTYIFLVIQFKTSDVKAEDSLL